MGINKNVVERHLIFSVRNGNTLRPMMTVPVAISFPELFQFITSGEVQIYSSPQGKGVEMRTWADVEVSFGSIFYKMSKYEDLAIISPLVRIKETGVVGFPIKEIGFQQISTFIPVQASSDNVDDNDIRIKSVFGLGRSLRGKIIEYDCQDLEMDSPLKIKCYSTGKVNISGAWSTFSRSGYLLNGGIYK